MSPVGFGSGGIGDAAKKRMRRRKMGCAVPCFSGLVFVATSVGGATGFVTLLTTLQVQSVSSYALRNSRYSSAHHNTVLFAKRNKKAQSREDAEDLNRWYDSVDADASPDDVFWEEMERQRLLSQVGSSPSSLESTSSGPSTPSPPASAAAVGNTGASQSLSRANSAVGLAEPNQRSAEATLSEYSAYAVADNWLDEELVWMMQDDALFDGSADDKSLEEQLDDWAEDEGDSDDDNTWMQSDEPWDHWGQSAEDQEEQERVKIDPRKAKEFLLKDVDSEEDNAEMSRQEEEFKKRMSKIRVKSERLERARSSPKAKAFFSREPNSVEGFDRLWVSAIDNACFKNLMGSFRNYGIEFADNFGDWEDGSLEDGFYSIEDIASFKARKVYEVTGLPCIASRSSFEIEPIPEVNTGGGRGSAPTTSSRVSSGYRFNDIGMHVDYICDALRPLSEPTRVTEFKTCLCYYDGEMEVFEYGIAEVDLVFANSLRTFIPVSQAVNGMIKTLELTFGLEYQPWLKKRVDETTTSFGGASVRLRDRVLKEGRVLPNDIVDVSSFMDSMVDVELMDQCAKELSQRFVDLKPNKILTVATTGLVIALPMAKYLQVPVVYARKERNVVMADTFKSGYSSKTVGKNRELLVSKSHLDEDDRVLVIDDFLSSGSSQEALMRIVAESGATAVGIGVLLEKVYDSGRQSLSGFDVPIHSMCRIASVQNGVIQLVEEDGYDRMQKEVK